MKAIHIIGGGLAGSEAAWQIAARGVPIVLHEMRPDILGATLAIEPDGTFTETIAFTSEAEAREGEKKEMPDMPSDVRDTLEMAMQGATFYDLHHPWFESSR